MKFKTFEQFINEGAELSSDNKVQVFNLLTKYKGKKIPDEIVHNLADDLNIEHSDVESYIYSLASKYVSSNNIKGGKGDKVKPEDVNQDELKVGIEVELEHTDNRANATEIAIDHLTEVENYYTILIKAGLVDEPKALELAKKLLNT